MKIKLHPPFHPALEKLERTELLTPCMFQSKQIEKSKAGMSKNQSTSFSSTVFAAVLAGEKKATESQFEVNGLLYIQDTMYEGKGVLH